MYYELSHLYRYSTFSLFLIVLLDIFYILTVNKFNHFLKLYQYSSFISHLVCLPMSTPVNCPLPVLL